MAQECLKWITYTEHMNINIVTGSIFLFIFLLIISCNEIKKVEPAPFSIKVPANLASSLPEPAHNKATPAGIELGKKLFFDPILSGNNQISCATCHQPIHAFGTNNKVEIIEGKSLLRHTPPLFNLAWARGWFWDGGAKNLESLVFAPIQNKNEMDQNLKDLVIELKNHVEYPALFKKAFNNDTISSSLIARALAQYQRTLISANSKYDRVLSGKEQFTASELKGKQIFEENCASCHIPGFFTDFDYHNNGLDSDFTDDSFERIYFGRYRITNNINDIGKYKTPSLRNIALTGPYMHDGRFKTLQEVLEHYNSGIKKSSTLDPLFEKDIMLSMENQENLISFLNTLTDEEFIKANNK